MNLFQQKLLASLNINLNELPFYFKEPSYNDLEDPSNFKNMVEVVNRIKKAIANKEKIMVYGDYDCDGVCATSILVKIFSLLNYPIGYYIPSRYIDGYGLNLNRAQQIKEKGYSLLITVDNGIVCEKEVNYLKENNVDVIITDHHEYEHLLDCLTLHPTLKNDNTTLKQCGAYVAFMLSRALLNQINDYLLVLASIATISDMMPLKEYNRDLVKLGLKILNEHAEYPLHLLTKNQIIDEETLGFIVCPKINAFGRIKEDTSVNDLVKFLTSDNRLLVSKIASEINQINEQRKNILSFAINQIDFSKYNDKKIIIDRFDDVSEGVIGLVAARILQAYQKPCIILTKSKGETILKGSARSIKGFPLNKIFDSVSDLLSSYGGHDEAGGLSLEEKNYSLLVNKINDLVKDVEVEKVEDEFLEVNKDDLSYENYLFIKKLSPFGMDYKLPLFKLEIDNNNISFIGVNKNHIKGQINDNCSFIGFNLANEIISKNNINCLGLLQYDDFKKGNNIVFKIEKIDS